MWDLFKNERIKYYSDLMSSMMINIITKVNSKEHALEEKYLLQMRKLRNSGNTKTLNDIFIEVTHQNLLIFYH